jgi:glutamate-1-semialdehyde 2,1-aminomutase
MSTNADRLAETQHPEPLRNQDLATSVADAEAKYVASNPRSARTFELAGRSLPGGNTRTTVHFSPFPLCIRSAEGGYVTDADDHRYVDLINEHTAGVLGHSDPAVMAALKAAIDQGLTFGGPCALERQLADLITGRFPAIEKLRFCNSGTEANILALATARAVTGKPAILVFEGAYHGSVLQFSGSSHQLNVPFEILRSRYNDSDKACSDIKTHADRLAAVILEPMQGGAGAIPADQSFVRALAKTCAEMGVLLIFDEVMTSRLSPSGLHGAFGVNPDLVTLGKYIAGGMTIGAFGGRADIMDRFDPSMPGAFIHGGTFNNNVLAMAAGVAAFEGTLSEDNIGAMNALGDGLRSDLVLLIRKHELPMQITGVGSIFAIHFEGGEIKNVDCLEPPATERGRRISQLKKLFQFDMIAAGIYVNRRILCNLSTQTSDDDLQRFLAAFEEFLSSRGGIVHAALQ